MAVIVPAAIAAAYGIYKVAHGAHQKNLAKKAAAANKRPAYNIPQGEYDNLYMAESQASQGLDQGSKQILTQNADRGLSASLNAVLKGGGDMNAASSLYDNYLGNINNIALMDNQQKINNVQQLVAARYRMSDQQDKQWQVNNYAPFMDKQKEIGQQKAYGQQQVDSGMGEISGAAISGVGSYNDAQNVRNVKIDPGASGATGSGGGNGGAMARTALGGNGGGSAAFPYSSNTYANSPSYGIDISKLNRNDANMVNSVLYGNAGSGGGGVYGTGNMTEDDLYRQMYGTSGYRN